MITIISDKFNTLDQISYNNLIQSIEVNQLPCSCGLTGNLIKHGYYKRSIKTPEGIVVLSLLRVKCTHCGKTHALFPTMIVPYSQVLLNDHLTILDSFSKHSSFEPIMTSNTSIDECNVRYIIKQYITHWQQRILSFNLSITMDILPLSSKCLLFFKRQFMQIKSTPNILFYQTHIT